MAKRSKKRHKGVGRAASKSSEQVLSGQQRQQVNLKRYGIWATGGLVAVVVVVVAWTFLKNTSPSTSGTISVGQVRAEVPADSSKTTISDSAFGSPQINFLETEYDFGTVAQGSKPSHTFVVRNVGNAPLRLIKAEGS